MNRCDGGRRFAVYGVPCSIAPGCCRQQGAAYLWMLWLVALIGLNLVLAVELDVLTVQRDREQELLSIGRQFRSAIKSYRNAAGANGEYPTSLEVLLQDDRVSGIRRHLRKVFVDPMTGQAEWGMLKVNGRIVGIHSLSDREPLKQDGFYRIDDRTLRHKSKYSEWIFSDPPDLSQTEPTQAEGPQPL